MSFKPISYLQTDPKWKNIKYATSAENTTIGGSGCGPTAAAMVVSEWTGKDETPDKACAWAQKNGYKATGQGTYYSFFVPYFKKFGLECKQLNGANVYGKTSAAVHLTAYNAVKNGDYVIACMGKGNWTSSGHFILWYGVDGDNVLINDPNSTAAGRLNASWNLFKSQVKYYFVITKPKTFVSGSANYTVQSDDGSMNIRFGAGTSYGVFGTANNGRAVYADKIVGNWARIILGGERYYISVNGLKSGVEETSKFGDTVGHWAEKTVNELAKMGIVNGDEKGNFRPDDNITRAEAAVMVRNAVRYVTGK